MSSMQMYMHGIAVVTRNAQQVHQTIDTMHTGLQAVGMQMTAKKTQKYQWTSQVVRHSIRGILYQPLLLVYVGHYIAHQSCQKLARQFARWTVDVDPTSYHGLPLNSWEKAFLTNVVLLPARPYWYMFIMDDHML